MDWVVQIGLVELALGGLLGWAMVIRQDRPQWLTRIGVVAPQRIRQVHLDYVMMGLILIGVGLAVPDLPTAIAAALVFGTLVNPFLFVPLAFNPDVEKQLWYRLLAVVSFVGVSGGLVAAAIVGARLVTRLLQYVLWTYKCRCRNAARVAAVAARIAAMPSLPKFSLLGALAAAIALLALPVAAEATLVYVKNPMKPAVFAANDNGGGAFRVGPGSNPKVSPDGDAIAYAFESSGGKRQLRLAAAAGGGSATVLTGLQDSAYVTFSPDSKLVAALRGPELGKRSLVLIDVVSGTFLRTVASGYFSGISFSPDGTELAYSVAASEKFPPKSNVYAAPIAGGKAVQLTRDGISQAPLWGPSGKIAFVKQLGAKQRKYGPKNELFLMNANGTQQKRLTHTDVGPLLSGLTPTEWSANGQRLLAEFGGQDTSYAVTVNPRTGAQKPLDKMGDGEQGFVGTALSGDGTTVLGSTGGFEPGPSHAVATIPYGGGKAKTLVKNAYEPDWSR